MISGTGHSRFEQSVGIGLGENAALAADFVQRESGVTHFGKLLGRDLQLARGLFDEGPRAARAGTLHQHLLAFAGAVAAEEDRLHILAADFTDESHGGVQLLNRSRHRHHFLHQFPTHQRRDQACSRAGKEDTVLLRS